MAKPVWTNQQIVNQLDSGMHWSGQALTYAFPTTASWFPYGEKAGASALSTAQKDAATLAIQLWDDLIAPDLTLTTNVATANIKAMNTTTDIGYAQGYFPGSSPASGSFWLNPAYNSSSGTNDLVTPKVGNWGFVSYVHELGHTFGLDHPGDYDGGSPTYAANALYAQDSQMYTVMSYFTASNTGADWVASDGKTYYPQTPMMHDILAIQAMYGAETTTRTGNTTYGFNATAGSWIYDFSQNTHPVLCIYDAGGTDTLDFSGWSYTCRIDLNPGSFSSSDMMTYNVSIAFGTWIENGIGGGGADVLTGNAQANVLSGLSGADQIDGGGGNDILYGGGDGDQLRGGSGNDTVYGGAGADAALFSGAFATYGVVWSDGLGAFVLTDHVGADGIDTLYEIETFAFADMSLSAAALLAAAQSQGGGGPGLPDPGVVDPPTPAPLTLIGTGANDLLYGADGADRLSGLAGNDVLNGLGGTDVLLGGAGSDIYVVDSAGDKVDETGGSGVDMVQASIDFNLSNTAQVTGSVENLTLIGAALAATGNSLANVLTGNEHDNVLDGLRGVDKMYGGLGNDIYVVDNAGDVVGEGGGGGLDTVWSSISFSLSNAARVAGDVENLSLGGTAAISGTGNALANVITGNASANVLAGLAGGDMLDGAGGADTATYVASTAGVSVSLVTGAASGGHADGDHLANIENLTGSAYDDVLEGDGGANVLAGGAHKAGGDTVSYAHAAAGVVVNLATTGAQNTIGAGLDKLSGFENLVGSQFADRLTGSTGNNLLQGLDGDDILNGGRGNDRLAGGEGYDQLTGGVGNDIFVFASWSDDLDTLTDFQSGRDRLEISAAGFGGGLSLGSAASLLTAASLESVSGIDGVGTFIFAKQGTGPGTLYWDADGGSSQGALAIASIATTMTAHDLFVV